MAGWVVVQFDSRCKCKSMSPFDARQDGQRRPRVLSATVGVGDVLKKFRVVEIFLAPAAQLKTKTFLFTFSTQIYSLAITSPSLFRPEIDWALGHRDFIRP